MEPRRNYEMLKTYTCIRQVGGVIYACSVPRKTGLQRYGDQTKGEGLSAFAADRPLLNVGPAFAWGELLSSGGV